MNQVPRLLFSVAAVVLSAAAACSSSSAGGAGTTPDGTSPPDAGPSARDAATTDGSVLGDSGGTDAGDGGLTGTKDYGKDGPFTVTTKNESASNGTSTIAVSVYVPSGTGPFPVVVLSSGLQQTALGYVPYAQRLASWGIVTILRDDPGVTTSTPTLSTDVEGEVTSWLPTADGAIYDTTRVGLAGHSRGAQAAMLAAENGLKGKTKGLFLLDPSGSSAAAVTPTLGQIGVPLAMIGETTDATGAFACAPTAENYVTMYAAAGSPALSITAVNADHTMFEDPNNCFGCFACGAGTANAASVLALSQRLMTTFFAKVLLADSSVNATLGIVSDPSTVTFESK